MRFMKEREFQSQVVSLAKRLGYSVYHTYDSRRSEPGFPDLVCVRDRVIFVELKTEKGRLSAAQRTWIERLANADAEIYVWRPGGLDGNCPHTHTPQPKGV